MAQEIFFYRLAPKPPARGEQAYAAAAEGRISRGRKWYRLETTPDLVRLFPDNWPIEKVLEWLDADPDVPAIDAVYHHDGWSILNHGPSNAVSYAIDQHRKGNPGWVVFLPHSGD